MGECKLHAVSKETVAKIRDRTLRVLKGCGVEMLIIDEADRFNLTLAKYLKLPIINDII